MESNNPGCIPTYRTEVLISVKLYTKSMTMQSKLPLMMKVCLNRPTFTAESEDIWHRALITSDANRSNKDISTDHYTSTDSA